MPNMAGRKNTVSDVELMKEFVWTRDPVLTAQEIASEVGMSYQGVTYRLE